MYTQVPKVSHFFLFTIYFIENFEKKMLKSGPLPDPKKV